MPWPAIEAFRNWTAKRKKLFQGVIGLAVEGVADCLPGGALALWATRIVGEFAKHGVERLSDTSANVPEVKPAGESISAEQLGQLNGWIASLSASYADLLDRLDALVTVRDDEPQEQLQALLRQTLSQNADLARDFDAHAEETRRQTLTLARIEERLDDIYHGQKGIALSLEEIKAFLLQCAAPPAEWERFRQARPEAMRLLVEADAHFLAGRREAGMDLLLRLMNERGVGRATLCQRLGGAWLGEGKLEKASQCLQQVVGPDGRPPAGVTRTLTSLISSSTRSSQLPVWRSLPRGFVIEERWRIDGEIGRGGMASVYRAEGIDDINCGQIAAIKVPAPGLLDDADCRQRFIQEIKVSQKLSHEHHRSIVETLGYVRLTDPHTKRTLYGLVLEFIDGQTLAHWLAQHQVRGEPIALKEIEIILKSVCSALEHAHGQNPPILHRDLKPPNIMLTNEGRIKLMDFGIARVLEDRRQTVTGGAMGTPAYMPPEFHDPNYQPDIRSDIYLAANLLVELLTFHPQGNAEKRSDCPDAWLELIGNAMNRLMRKRPASIGAFRDQLRAGLSPKPEVEPAKPPKETTSQTPVPPAKAPLSRRLHGDKIGDTIEVPLIKALRMKFAWVPPGTSWLGGGAGKPGTEEFTLANGLWCGVYPVTQAEWQAVMGNNPSHFAGKPRHPVENVSWNDVQKFLKKLNSRLADGGLMYRLPSEDEWEYICRGGPIPQAESAYDFYFARSKTDLASAPTNDLSSRQANFDGNYPAGSASKGPYLKATSEVGLYLPNSLGIHDLHGNVWEWTSTLGEGSSRLIRGGSWSDGKDYCVEVCTASIRDWYRPGVRNFNLGFRVLAVPSGAK